MENRKLLPAGIRRLLRAMAGRFWICFGQSRELSLMALGYRDSGVDCLKAGDYEQALRHATKVIELHRAAAEGYALRAHICRFNGHTDQGIEDATECIRLCPRQAIWLLADAFCSRAELLLLKRDLGRAIADATEAIRLTGTFAYFARCRAWAHCTRGNARVEQKDYAAAVSDFSEAFRLNPKDTYSFRQIAYCHFRQGEFDQVIRDCNEAIRLDPQQAAWCCVTRAAAQVETGDLDAAISSCTDAIRRDRDLYLAYTNRGEALRRKGDRAAAAADFAHALHLSPSDPTTLACYALLSGESRGASSF
jgi:tetratricopeptide (TPR) repeat protein